MLSPMYFFSSFSSISFISLRSSFDFVDQFHLFVLSLIVYSSCTAAIWSCNRFNSAFISSCRHFICDSICSRCVMKSATNSCCRSCNFSFFPRQRCQRRVGIRKSRTAARWRIYWLRGCQGLWKPDRMSWRRGLPSRCLTLAKRSLRRRRKSASKHTTP